MKITKKTRTRQILPLLTTAERVQWVVDNIPPFPLPTPVTQMTIGEYIEATQESYIERLLKQKYAYIAFGQVRQLRSELDALGKYLKKLMLKLTADEEAAQANVPWLDSGQRMVVDVIKWGLATPAPGEPILDAAEKVKVSAWLLMNQDRATAAQYERNLSDIREKRWRSERRRVR